MVVYLQPVLHYQDKVDSRGFTAVCYYNNESQQNSKIVPYNNNVVHPGEMLMGRSSLKKSTREMGSFGAHVIGNLAG